MREYAQDEVNGYFDVLAESLAKYHLPTQSGEYRQAASGEFMFMGHTEDTIGVPVMTFKHRDTRNYLWLKENGQVIVPTGSAWHRGYFDAFDYTSPEYYPTEEVFLR